MHHNASNIYYLYTYIDNSKASSNKLQGKTFLQIYGRHHIWDDAILYNKTCGMGHFLTKKTKNRNKV